MEDHPGLSRPSQQVGSTPMNTALVDVRKAAIDGDTQVLDEILNKLGDSAKQSILEKDAHGDTVLHDAVSSSTVEVVNRLLAALDDQAKECIFESGYQGRTVLHVAALASDLNMVKALADKLTDDESRAVIAMKNTIGHTVLHVAADKGDKDVVEFLLSKLGPGAAEDVILAKSNNGRSVLFASVRSGHEQVFHLLVNALRDEAFRDEILQTDSINRSLLHAAVEGGSVSILGKLLASLGEQAKHAIQTKDSRGSSVLDLALASNNPMVLALVLDDEQHLDGETNGRTLLHAHAYNGNLEMLKEVVERMGHRRAKYEAFQKDELGRTALHHAAVTKSTSTACAVFEYLLEVLANRATDALKEKDNDGDTVLHYAAVSPDYINILELIVKKLEDPVNGLSIQGLKNNSSDTVLHTAVYNRNARGLRVLLRSIDPEHVKDTICETGEGGRTVLHAAAMAGDVDIFRMLISELGPETAVSVIGRETSVGHNVLHLAADDGHVTIVELMVKYLGDGIKDAIRQVSSNGRTVLYASVRSGHLQVFKVLMSALGDEAQDEVLRKDKVGSTLLHAAVQGGKVEIFKALVEALGDQAMKAFQDGDKDGDALLYWAVYFNRKDILQELKPHIRELLPLRNHNTHTALHLAATRDSDMLEYVIHLATSLDGLQIKEVLNCTTLNAACQIRSNLLVKLLLENGGAGDVTMRDERFLGNTALHAAAIGGDLQVFDQLVQSLGAGPHNVNDVRNSFGQTPLHFAVAENEFEVAEWLIKEGKCDPTQADFAGVTPLHFAARGQASERVLELLKESLGAKFEDSVNRETDAGLTPLHYAAWNGNEAAIRWLIEEAGVNVNLEAVDRTETLTPCMWAAMGSHSNFKDENGDSTDLFSYLVSAYLSKGKHPLWNEPELFSDDGFKVSAPNNLMDMLCFKTIQQADLQINGSLVSCAIAYGDGTTAEALASRLRNENKDMSVVYDMVETARPIQLAAMCSDVDPSMTACIEEFLRIITTDEDENKDVDHDKLQLELESAFIISVGKGTKEFVKVLLKYMTPLRVRELLQQRLCEVIGLKESVKQKHERLDPFDRSRIRTVDALVKDIPLAYWIACGERSLRKKRVKDQIKNVDIGPKTEATTAQEESSQTIQKTISFIMQIVNQMTQGSPDSQAEVDYIKERYPNNVGRYTGRTALHWAVIFGEKEMVRELCKVKKCEKDILDNFGKLPYWYATLHQDEFQNEEYNEFVNHLKWDQFYESLHKDRDMYVDGLNAILVGAALIATVTFAGVLTPPLQYPVKSSDQTPDLKYVAIYKPGVQIFWICISMSFFFSMASALAGVTGILPNTSAFDLLEVQRIRRLLVRAALYLVISIVFVLLAFGAAGFSVLPGALRLQANMIATTLVGGAFCIYRLLRFGRAIYHLTPNNYVRKMVAWLKPYFRREVERVEPGVGSMEMSGEVSRQSKYVRGSINEAILKAGGFSACTYSWDDGLWDAPFAKTSPAAKVIDDPPFIVCE